MKIRVDKILEEGLDLTEKLEAQKISSDFESEAISLIGSIDVEARFTRTGKEVFVDVALEAPIEYTCSRCLAKFQDVFKKKFSMNYEVNPASILEIDEDIRQEMILDSPMKVVCKPDCKGLCPRCGQNLNVAECECK